MPVLEKRLNSAIVQWKLIRGKTVKSYRKLSVCCSNHPTVLSISRSQLTSWHLRKRLMEYEASQYEYVPYCDIQRQRQMGQRQRQRQMGQRQRQRQVALSLFTLL